MWGSAESRRPGRRALRIATAAIAATAALAGPAATAQAIGIAGVHAAPADPRAGAHSDFTLSFSVTDPGDGLRDLTVDLPTGLLGNPTAAPQCPEAQLAADACPAATVVGSTTTSVTATLGPLRVPLDVPGTVYNVEPPAGEPARLGLVLRPLGGLLGGIAIVVRIAVRDDSDYGLRTTIDDLPRSQAGIPIDIRALSLTLTGALPGGGRFMVNPTSCATATTRITATSYASTRPVTASGSFTPTDCAGEPFAPGMEIGLEQSTPDAPGAQSIALTQPADVDGRAVSHVRRAVVRLPEGTTLNPSLAPALALCSDAQFGAQGDPRVSCPAASRIGHVAFDNPLLGTVPGDVYFGRTASDPYRLLIVGAKSGVTVKIAASVRPDDDTGRITTIFDDLPQVPFTKFDLTFDGGPRAALVTPPACGTYTGSITATPWSGAAAQTPTTSFAISDDGRGGCTPHETPRVAGSVSTTRALASPTLTLDLSRDATSRRPSRLEVTLPRGLAGKLAGVPACATSRALAGRCPSSTELGSVTTVAGSGPEPITLRGTAYLGTGTSTALARIWLDIPVAVGPFDLGSLVLANTLTLGADDGRVHVTTTLPAAFKGFPIALRSLRLTIDRKGFLINPSGCDARQFDVAMTAVDGTQGGATGPFQATDCDLVPFAPKLATTVDDPDVRARGSEPPFSATISKHSTEAAVARVRLLLPDVLVPNIDRLTVADDAVCQPAQVDADACPPGSLLGARPRARRCWATR